MLPSTVIAQILHAINTTTDNFVQFTTMAILNLNRNFNVSLTTQANHLVSARRASRFPTPQFDPSVPISQSISRR
jgi:hypothetical protein